MISGMFNKSRQPTGSINMSQAKSYLNEIRDWSIQQILVEKEKALKATGDQDKRNPELRANAYESIKNNVDDALKGIEGIEANNRRS